VELRQAEVEHFRLAVASNQDVARLEIPVHHAVPVGGRDRCGQRLGEGEEGVGSEAARRDHFVEHPAVDQLHG
jgi:hypothetical protein